MDIIKQNIGLFYNLSFKTRCYRKNFDMVTPNEHIITEYDGNIGELRIAQKKRPKIVGEFGYSVWNIGLGKLLDVDFDKLIDDFGNEDTYKILRQTIDDKLFNVEDYNKIVFIHTLLIKKNYRKRNLTEEFIETMYREFHNDKTAIIALVKPLQNNKIDEQYYLNEKTVDYLSISGDTQTLRRIPASEYYSLRDLYVKDDDEFNNLKLYAVADRCGLARIGESHLFKFSPEKTEERLKLKMKYLNELQIKWESRFKGYEE